MPTLTWWLLHVVQAAALLTAVLAALAAARRAGGHTLYGNLLFLLGLSFWALLLAEASFVGRQAMGAWEGPGSFIDVLALMGWAAFTASIFLFVDRFADPATPVLVRRVRLLAMMALPVALLLLVFRFVLSLPGADPDAWVRVPYLIADGAVLGLIIGGIDRFVRLRASALGRLYGFLGVAVLSKTASDVYWAYLAAHDATSPVATAFSAAAGLMAVAGLLLHTHHMGREDLPPSAHMPWLRPEQHALAALASRLHGVAGGYAARTVLVAAGAVFDRHGVPWRLEGRTILAHASGPIWKEVLRAAQEAASDIFGAAGHAAATHAAGGGTWAA